MNFKRVQNSFLAILFLPVIAHSAEVDHFTIDPRTVVNVSDALNERANTYLAQAAAASNQSSDCDEDRLYQELRKYFSNFLKGQLIKDILYENKIPMTLIPLDESVYREWSVWDGFILGRSSAKKNPLAITPLIRLDEQVIGVDKLEHLFGMGFTYFNKYHRNGKNIHSVLKEGVFREKMMLGGNMFETGIFSYADLSANLNGMRFWNHILQKSDDILGSQENKGPFIRCEASRWVVNSERSIDFRTYIDASLDESINCSKFARESGERKFKKEVEARSSIHFSVSSSCPVNPEKLKQMNVKYQNLEMNRYIINMKGTGTVSYFSETQPLEFSLGRLFLIY